MLFEDGPDEASGQDIKELLDGIAKASPSRIVTWLAGAKPEVARAAMNHPDIAKRMAELGFAKQASPELQANLNRARKGGAVNPEAYLGSNLTSRDSVITLPRELRNLAPEYASGDYESQEEYIDPGTGKSTYRTEFKNRPVEGGYESGSEYSSEPKKLGVNQRKNKKLSSREIRQ